MFLGYRDSIVLSQTKEIWVEIHFQLRCSLDNIRPNHSLSPLLLKKSSINLVCQGTSVIAIVAENLMNIYWKDLENGLEKPWPTLKKSIFLLISRIYGSMCIDDDVQLVFHITGSGTNWLRSSYFLATWIRLYSLSHHPLHHVVLLTLLLSVYTHSTRNPSNKYPVMVVICYYLHSADDYLL